MQENFFLKDLVFLFHNLILSNGDFFKLDNSGREFAECINDYSDIVAQLEKEPDWYSESDRFLIQKGALIAVVGYLVNLPHAHPEFLYGNHPDASLDGWSDEEEVKIAHDHIKYMTAITNNVRKKLSRHEYGSDEALQKGIFHAIDYVDRSILNTLTEIKEKKDYRYKIETAVPDLSYLYGEYVIPYIKTFYKI